MRTCTRASRLHLHPLMFMRAPGLRIFSISIIIRSVLSAPAHAHLHLRSRLHACSRLHLHTREREARRQMNNLRRKLGFPPLRDPMHTPHDRDTMSDVAPAPKKPDPKKTKPKRSAARSTPRKGATSPGDPQADRPASSSKPDTAPKQFSRELWNQIYQRLADGESLLSICRDPAMPADSTVRKWVVEDVDGIAAEYARARDLGLDRMAEEVVEISDDSRFDIIMTEDGPKVDGEAINRTKLRVDTRKWLLSKLAPKRYGDRMQIDATHTHQFEQMDDRELFAEARRIAERLGVTLPDLLTKGTSS